MIDRLRLLQRDDSVRLTWSNGLRLESSDFSSCVHSHGVRHTWWYRALDCQCRNSLDTKHRAFKICWSCDIFNDHELDFSEYGEAMGWIRSIFSNGLGLKSSDFSSCARSHGVRPTWWYRALNCQCQNASAEIPWLPNRELFRSLGLVISSMIMSWTSVGTVKRCYDILLQLIWPIRWLVESIWMMMLLKYEGCFWW